MPSALVTGATGLLGSHIAERLRDAGWSVRALVREPGRAAWLEQEGVELSAGDVLDAASFARAAHGCDVIFHAAAALTPAGGGWEAYRRPNVDGTRNAIAAAHAASARLLHVSSVAVYGSAARYDRGPGRTDEDVPLAPLLERHWYARSKRESERLVLDAHARGQVWATAIRPDVIYGRRDRQFVPRMARLLRLGVLPLPGGGRATLAIVHAANVADAALLAATSDAAGGLPFNVANDPAVTGARFFELAAAGMGRRVRILPVPVPVARAGVAVARRLLSISGARGLAAMLDGTIGFVTRDNPFDSSRARRVLGWEPRVQPEEGIPDAFRWAAEHRHRDAG